MEYRDSHVIRKQDLLYEAAACFLGIARNAQMALVLLV